MSYIKITCAHPGLRRAGIAHEKVKTWPADTFTADQLAQLRADPAFVVEEVSDVALPPPLFSVKIAEGDEVLIDPVVTDELLGDLEELFGNEPSFLTVRGSLLAIFAKHGWNTPEGRSGTAREAPSADSGPAAEAPADASGGAQPAAPLSDGAAPVPATDAASATTNTRGAPPADAEAPSSEATTPSQGDAPVEGAAAPETPAAQAAGTDPNGEGGEGEEAAVRPAASAPGKAKPAAKARPAKAKG